MLWLIVAALVGLQILAFVAELNERRGLRFLLTLAAAGLATYFFFNFVPADAREKVLAEKIPEWTFWIVLTIAFGLVLVIQWVIRRLLRG